MEKVRKDFKQKAKRVANIQIKVLAKWEEKKDPPEEEEVEGGRKEKTREKEIAALLKIAIRK